MIQEALVEFETAKLLKEAGFPQEGETNNAKIQSSMWIARDKNGKLYLFSNKPVCKYGIWRSNLADPTLFYEVDAITRTIKIMSEAFPEVTFENSPKELVIK